MSQSPSDKHGARIQRGKLMDEAGWQDTHPQNYVDASDYEVLRLRFEKACAEITRLSALSHVAAPLDAAGFPKVAPTMLEQIAIEALNEVKAWIDSDRAAPLPVETRMKIDAVLMTYEQRRAA